MDHVVGCRDETDFFMHRHDQRVIDFQQVVIDALTRFRATLVRQFAMPGVDGGHETDTSAFTGQVVVAPLPLHPGHFDSQIGCRGVLHLDH